MLGCFCNISRMQDQRFDKSIHKWKTVTSRIRRRPKNYWYDELLNNFKILNKKLIAEPKWMEKSFEKTKTLAIQL